MALAKKLKNFAQAGAQGVKRASESEDKPYHYSPGTYDGYERIVQNKMFNPVRSGSSNYNYGNGSNYGNNGYNGSTNFSQAPRAQANAEDFKSKWSDELQAMYDQIANRPKFSYDQSKDPLYQQYAEMYRKNAQLAMDDTVARAASLTGGYGNSYAETAGQAMYNQQMDNLNQRALDLYYAALDTYDKENQNMYQKFNLAGQMYNNDYNAWRDKIADSQWAQNYDFNAWEADVANQKWGAEFDYNRYLDDRNYNYQLSRDAISDKRYDTEWEYQLERDKVADDRYKTEWDYQVGRDKIADERYTDETKYAREQADLDRALQYYQAGYDPNTRGMSAEARQQYELGLRAQGIDPATGNMTTEAMLKYLQANGTNDGVDAYVDGLTGLSKAQKEQMKAMYHNTGKISSDDIDLMKGFTPDTQAFITGQGFDGGSPLAYNNNGQQIITRAEFTRRKNESANGKVPIWGTNGKVKEGYSTYEEWVKAYLKDTDYTTEEKAYLLNAYTAKRKQ